MKKMKRINTVLRLQSIIFRRALPLFLIPIALAYVVMPLTLFVSLQSGEIEKTRRLLVFAMHTLLPIGATLWGMAYLQPWMENGEALRACRACKHSNALAELLLCLEYTALLAPLMLLFQGYGFSFWWEYALLALEMTFLAGVFLLMTCLLRSVTMGGMLSIAYLLFCFLFSGNDAVARICLIRTNVGAVPQNLTDTYLPLALLCLLCYASAALAEKHMAIKSN